ncbi:Membrane protein involved in the export of O-antigen and teichoic acid [Ruminococcaceae bacterium YAD3003]|nr:Membrane protein involved in the export of O-antigen and teichoic acid [Ruminococcaceae bacterium YAD3003]
MSNKSDVRGKYLVKNTAIFALGNIATKFITFFLVPLYTNALSKPEYGIVDLVSTISIVLAPILILNINEAVMRFSLDKNADYERIMSIGLSALVGGILIGIAVIPISSLFNSISSLGLLIYLYTISLGSSQLFLSYLRGREKLILYSIGNFLNTLLIAIFNILFLLYFKLGVKGYIYAFILSYTITAIYAFIAANISRVIIKFKFDIMLAKQMVKYSVVLIPNTFMWWIMNSSDRVMVTYYLGAAANGVYAISNKLPSLISLFASVFSQAWSYSAVREDGSVDESEYSNSVFKMFISVVMLCGIGLLTVIKVFLYYYVAESFFEAWKYTPFLIIGCVYLALATFMSTSYTVHKDSFGFLFSAAFGASLNVVLNFMLILTVGIQGAAIATCISYIAVFLFRLFHTRKYLYYNVNIKEFYFGTIMMIITTILMFVDNIYGFLFQFLILAISLIFYYKSWMPLISKFYMLIKGKMQNGAK